MISSGFAHHLKRAFAESSPRKHRQKLDLGGEACTGLCLPCCGATDEFIIDKGECHENAQSSRT
jgi:hypothetical protein